MVHAGTVHSLRQVVVFELQENSDKTYRLYDWEHTDPATGEPRPLQVNQALASVSFPQGPVEPWRVSGSEETELRDQILSCEHFEVWRIRSSGGYSVGSSRTPHVLVCLSGAGRVSHGDAEYPFGKGDVVLLPPALGGCACIAVGAVDWTSRFQMEQAYEEIDRFRPGWNPSAEQVDDRRRNGPSPRSALEGREGGRDLRGRRPQFQKQVLAHLSEGDSLKNLSLLPTCGTKFFQYGESWKELYSEDFTTSERTTILAALNQAVDKAGNKPAKVWGEVIEDRGSQITFSALGQQAPLEEKSKWDLYFKKRERILAILTPSLRGFRSYGGAISIDITKPGIDKGYGIHKLRDTLGITIPEMIFVGDALFPGGNDYPAMQAGAYAIRVNGPAESKKVIEAIIGCLGQMAQPDSSDTLKGAVKRTGSPCTTGQAAAG